MRNRRNRIRLNESMLKRIIKESVKRVLREGGNLYWRDADGVAHTNSKTYYRGVPGALFVYHGEESCIECDTE